MVDDAVERIVLDFRQMREFARDPFIVQNGEGIRIVDRELAEGGSFDRYGGTELEATIGRFQLQKVPARVKRRRALVLGRHGQRQRRPLGPMREDEACVTRR